MTIKVLLFGDVHFSKNSTQDEKRWFPGIDNFIGLFSEEWKKRFISYWDKKTQRKFDDFLDKFDGDKYSECICLGDMTPGTKESGIVSPKAREEAEEFLTKLRSAVPINISFIFGNHDLGYRPPVGYKKGGPSLTSLRTAQEIYATELFYSRIICGRKFIFLTSELFYADAELQSLKTEQYKYLERELECDEPVFLVIHDPHSLKVQRLKEILLYHEHKIESILCGHLHSEFIGRIVRLFLPLSKKITVVSSTFGFLGFNPGYAELTLHNPHGSEIRHLPL